MAIYWSFRAVPELSRFSRAERNRLWRRCSGKVFRRWQAWVVIGVAVVCSLTASFTAVFLRLNSPNIVAAILTGFLCGLVGTGLGVVIVNHVIISIALPYLREEISSLCISCGYSLTGNVSGVCPECGTKIG